MVKLDVNLDREFYISIFENKRYEIFQSDCYKMTELEFLTLIKILYKERRFKSVGKKLLDVYRSVYEDDYEYCNSILERMGIKENEKRQPTISTRSKTR